MPLRAEATERDAVSKEFLRECVVGVGLLVDALGVVVVEEQHGLGVSLVGPAEGIPDQGHRVGRARFQERVLTGSELDASRVPGVLEDLVGDVPLVDLAGVPTDDGGDVVLQHGPGVVAGPGLGSLVDPSGVLAVPEQRVAAHRLSVLTGELHDEVGAAEVVDTLFGVDQLPLHVVLGRDRVELGREQVLVVRRLLAVVAGEVALAPRGAADLDVLGSLVAQ